MPIIRVGDDLIDDETGEYAGPADSTLPDVLETDEHLILFMRRLMTAESAVQAKRRELDAIIENCNRLVAQEQRRVDWLKSKYGANAQHLLRAVLPRKADGTYRVKTFTCPWGQASLRVTRDKIVVDNPDEAIRWCEANRPEAVKTTKSILVSNLTDSDRAKIQDPFLPEFTGMKYIEGEETVQFKTIGKVDDDS